jgi:hypothetical protein
MEETRYGLHSFMLDYQDRHDYPPLMREMVDACPTLTWRSSVRHNLLILLDEGLVEERGETGTKRRWWAVDHDQDIVP